MTKSPTTHSLDLRAWLDDARALGELTDVSGADWNLELGAISELNVKKERSAALLFDDIPGYPSGHRVGTMPGPRRATALRVVERG